VKRLLGVDLGTRRVGLALAGEDDLRARPLATVPRRRTPDEDAAALRTIVVANAVDEIVVGLPLDMDGGEGAMAAEARRWASAIAERLDVPVRLRDERLSSHVAELRAGPPRRGRAGGPPGPVRRAARRARLDREAAAVILEDELAGRRTGRAGEAVIAAGPGEGGEEETT
jgi:putative Holliday junction resolvase